MPPIKQNVLYFKDIFIQDFLDNLNTYIHGTPHQYCNNLYHMYVTVNNAQYIITNFQIAIQCFERAPGINSDAATGIYLYNPHNKLNNITDIDKYVFNLVLETENTVEPNSTTTEAITFSQSLPLYKFLEDNKAYLVKIPDNKYTNLNNNFKAMFKTGNPINTIAGITSFLTPSQISKFPVLNSGDDIEHQLDLWGFVDGVTDTNPVLTAFNDDVVTPISLSSLSLSSLSLSSSSTAGVNSMDCYINALPDKDNKNIIRLKYGIIRTTIDFFHDYVSLAVNLFDKFKIFVTSANEDKFSSTGRITWGSIITIMNDIQLKVTTTGGNVSQTACKNLWTKYAIDYRRELSISCFPISEFGNIGSADIYSDDSRTKFTAEFDKLCKKIKDDLQIHHFYLEAQNTPLAKALIKQGFGMVISNIAERDAGSGYSIKTAIIEGITNKLNPEPSIYMVNRANITNQQLQCPTVTLNPLLGAPPTFKENHSIKTATITNGPQCLISKFLGLSNMEVVANDSINTITSTLKPVTVTVSNITNGGGRGGAKTVAELAAAKTAASFAKRRDTKPAVVGTDDSYLDAFAAADAIRAATIKRANAPSNAPIKIQQLGLNALIASTNVLTKSNYDQLRGAGSASAISQITMSPSSITNTTKSLVEILILSLKTYTDYCQADEIEQLKTGGIKVIAASSDFLASRTFSDFFATPSVYVGINKVIVTCSDTRFGTLTSTQISNRLTVFTKLCSYTDIIKQYIKYTIDYVNKYIIAEKIVTLSPSTYYGCSSVELYLVQTLDNANKTIDNITNQKDYFYNPLLSDDDKRTFLKQFPDKLSIYISELCKINLLSMVFNESHAQITKIIQTIVNIDGRISTTYFLNIYEEVKQEIINALPTTTSLTDLNIHIISIFTIAISTKNTKSVNNFIVNLEYAIAELKKNNTQNQVIILFTQILDAITFVNKLNTTLLSQYTQNPDSANTMKPLESPQTEYTQPTGKKRTRSDSPQSDNTKKQKLNIGSGTDTYNKFESDLIKLSGSQLHISMPTYEHTVKSLISYVDIIDIVTIIIQQPPDKSLSTKSDQIFQNLKTSLSGGKKKTKKTRKTRNTRKTRRNKTIRKMKNKK